MCASSSLVAPIVTPAFPAPVHSNGLLGKVERPIKGEIWLQPDQEEPDEHEGIDVAKFDDIEE